MVQTKLEDPHRGGLVESTAPGRQRFLEGQSQEVGRRCKANQGFGKEVQATRRDNQV
jgi:hypothetical protein